MTNYNLAEFQSWLQTNKKEWHDHFANYAWGEKEVFTFTQWVTYYQVTYANLQDVQWLRTKNYGWDQSEKEVKVQQIIALVKEFQQEKERKREQNTENNMFHYINDFQNWLKADPTRQQNLPYWEEFLALNFPSFRLRELNLLTEKVLVWEQEQGQLFAYLEIYQDWLYKKLSREQGIEYNEETRFRGELISLSLQLHQVCSTIKELQGAKEELASKLTESEITLTDVRQQLDQLKSELTKKEQEKKELETCLTEEQKKLTTEQNKNNQLNNLNKQTEEKLTTLQKTKESLEEILKEEQQKNKTLNQQFTKLEKEKKRLDQELKSSQTKITQLEQNIADLKKSNSAREITNLKSQIQQLKQEQFTCQSQLNEEIKKGQELQDQCNKLAQEVKEWEQKKIIVLEGKKTGLWVAIKTPLKFIGIILLITLVIGWIRSKLKE